jgi:metal-dependent amidase/aminoacylase/carboxypeptidase family protein
MTIVDAAEAWLDGHYDDLVRWRRHLHAHPELGRQEFATTQFVASHLADAGLNPKVLPGGTGLTCDFGPEHGPRIALRADMDALPMAERTGAPYTSEVPNVAHACGHDAHTAILLGSALALASAPELPVGVRLVFQAAEELMPGGAIDAIAAGALTGVSRIFALHCDPRLAVGKVAVRPGPITSAADQLEVLLQSHGGHTSRPHLTGDVGCGQRGRGSQCHPAVRNPGRYHPHGESRDLADAGIDCARYSHVSFGAVEHRAHGAVPAGGATGGQRGNLDPHPHPCDRVGGPRCAV